MWFGLITLFPQMFDGLTKDGIVGRAIKAGNPQVEFFNPRQWSDDKHQTVDGSSYGGGPGLLLKLPVLAGATEAALNKAQGDSRPQILLLSPRGKPLNQKKIAQLSKQKQLILVCGRYEGVDERFVEQYVDEEISIGDYVLSGGELPAMVLIDAITRCLSSTLGNEQSAVDESFSNGLLEYAQYTRPRVYAGRQVPDVLLSGDHQKIKRWRLQNSLGQTWLKRPDLLEKQELNQQQQELLKQFIQLHKQEQ